MPVEAVLPSIDDDDEEEDETVRNHSRAMKKQKKEMVTRRKMNTTNEPIRKEKEIQLLIYPNCVLDMNVEVQKSCRRPRAMPTLVWMNI